MTITTTAPVTLSDVMAELRSVTPGRAYPISLGDADVRALAGIPSGSLSLTDLKGKSAYVAMTVTATDASTGGLVSGTGSFTATVNPSASVFNGLAPYAVLWEVLSSTDGGFVLANATLLTCSVSHSISRSVGYKGSASLRCRVTDSAGQIVYSNTVIAEFIYEPNN